MEFLKAMALAFVPLFVAIDAPGLVPVFVGMTSDIDLRRQHRIINQATLVSAIIAFTFTLSGLAIFGLLSIQVQDFQIGGGLLLFCYAIVDILASGRRTRRNDAAVGIVPLATPLIAGPALLTTIILMQAQHGQAVTLAALAANLVVVWLALRAAHWFSARIGREVLSGVSKVLMVLLAGIGVMMVRQGVGFYLANMNFHVVPAGGVP
ncbi:MAG: MarC family protein [Planctomycetes bacterium]|nr:MarC family protein [Planctomycetota bacterium]